MKFFDGPYILRFSEYMGLRWYSLLISISVIIGLYLIIKEFKRRNYSPDDALDLAIYTVISGFIGARLYYVLWNWSTYAADPLSILRVWEGGLAIYGGVIAGALAIIVYAKIKKYKFSILADIAAPALVLGQAIGRWGNYFNNEAFGMPVTDPKFQFFPNAVKIPLESPLAQYFMNEWFQATFFIESMVCLAIFVLLFLYRKRQKFNGELILIYMFLYGIERAIVEGFRTDSLYFTNTDIRVSQVLSIALVIVSAVLLAWNYFRVFTKKKISSEMPEDTHNEEDEGQTKCETEQNLEQNQDDEQVYTDESSVEEAPDQD